MDISALQAFIAVARYRSFSIASEHLFVTQPAISKRVAALENELGTQLFNRVARQISLTEAGQHLLPKAQELVNQAADLQRYVTNLNKEVSGELPIAISHHIGLHRMPPVLHEFNSGYPQVNLDILFDDSDQALKAVLQGDIEFAVITLPQSLPEMLRHELIWRDELCVVSSPKHPLAALAQVDFRELSEFGSVLPLKETETHQIMLREFEQRQLELQVQMETNNLETLKMLVAAGLGWSLLPRTLLDNSLQAIKMEHEFERGLGVVQHRKRSLSNAAKKLLRLIQDSAQ